MFKDIKRRASVLAAAILLLLGAACSGNTVRASQIQMVAENLNCVCGSCDLILSDCTCETASQLTTEIQKGLSKGHPAEQVVQDLVQRYGQRVLVEKSHA